MPGNLVGFEHVKSIISIGVFAGEIALIEKQQSKDF